MTNQAQPHNNLGQLLEKRGDISRAEQEYRKAVNLNPSFELARSNLGRLLKDKGGLVGVEMVPRAAS